MWPFKPVPSTRERASYQIGVELPDLVIELAHPAADYELSLQRVAGPASLILQVRILNQHRRGAAAELAEYLAGCCTLRGYARAGRNTLVGLDEITVGMQLYWTVSGRSYFGSPYRLLGVVTKAGPLSNTATGR